MNLSIKMVGRAVDRGSRIGGRRVHSIHPANLKNIKELKVKISVWTMNWKEDFKMCVLGSSEVVAARCVCKVQYLSAIEEAPELRLGAAPPHITHPTSTASSPSTSTSPL